MTGSAQGVVQPERWREKEKNACTQARYLESDRSILSLSLSLYIYIYKCMHVRTLFFHAAFSEFMLQYSTYSIRSICWTALLKQYLLKLERRQFAEDDKFSHSSSIAPLWISHR